MKFRIKCILFFFLLFFLNICFYFVSSDYKSFITGLKYGDTEKHDSETLYVSHSEVSDKSLSSLPNDSILFQVHKEAYNQDDKPIRDKIQKREVLGRLYKNIKKDFENYYDFKKIQVNSKLFELTDEYPDYYYEYYSPKVTLYLFPSREFIEIFDIFSYLENELPFFVNRVDNFGTSSFYINMSKDIDDEYVRMVIEQNGITFGLQVLKDEYNAVKDILQKNNFNY